MDFSFGPTPLHSGSLAQVTCIVNEGDTPLQITWAFHGNSASATPAGVQTSKFGTKSSILMIESVTSEHSGNYTCTARNHAGVANYTAELIVNGTYNMILG